ncbi:MAG: hypothetical protein GYA34_02270 [Chloroflexi bacterium]|nr:hypothetical protein [Chloroflexota bacterium]
MQSLRKITIILCITGSLLLLQSLNWLSPASANAMLSAESETTNLTESSSAALSLYGTFHAMGVNVNISIAEDPDRDAAANIEYRTGSNPYQPGFPLSRVSLTRFSGSLFWLSPGTSYDVRVTFSDPDGGSLNGKVLQASGCTRADLEIPIPNRTYFVSPSGSGSACTQNNPCSLTQGISQVQAGEQVTLLGGIYYAGEIQIPRSGNSGAPIVIRGMTGQTAVLDGSDPADFPWTLVKNGIYRTTVNTADAHLVTANGSRLFPYISYSDLSNHLWGIPGFFADNTTVYVRLAGNADPNSAEMVVSRYNHAFLVEQDYIYFLTTRQFDSS